MLIDPITIQVGGFEDLPQNHVIAWPIFHMRTHVLLLKEDYKCIYARHSSVVHIE